MKRRVYAILEKAHEHDLSSRSFDIFIVTLIFLNVIAVILETVQGLAVRYHLFFLAFEIFSVTVFTIEYALRIWSIRVNKKYRDPFTGRLRYIVTPMALVDLFAILPFYLPIFMPFDLRFLRILRLFRLFRIFKIGRYSHAVQMIGKVFKSKKEEFVISLVIVFILLITASSFMYIVEHKAQPEIFSSIPASMWWGMITLTTVGYGDVIPATGIGRFLGMIIALLGIGVVALPTGILASGFADAMRNEKSEQKICPHCHKKIR